MTVLAPPTVKGPVLSTSPWVRVDGVLAGAIVEVAADDGTVHAEGTAGVNGTVWLSVGTPLREGSTLVARQKRGPGRLESVRTWCARPAAAGGKHAHPPTGGFGGYGNPISVSKVTWRVQQSWAAGSVTGSGPTTNVVLPPPPAGTPNPRASVYLEEFEGTRIDGGIPFKLWPDALAPMTIGALTKPALHVGFLLLAEVREVYEDYGQVVDYIWRAVIRWQGTA